jgi:PhnB protein
MATLDSYIFFDGNCAEAMRFYERVTGGKILMMLKYSDSPVPHDPKMCAPGDMDRVMHANLVIEGRSLMASDTPAGQFKPMQGFSLSLTYATPEEAKARFDMLADGGTVQMPFAPTFWSKGFGMVVDKFGTPWMVGGGAVHPQQG